VKDFIARENIKRFKAQLRECGDPHQKATLQRLLEDEEQRLHDMRFGGEKGSGAAAPR